MSRITQDHNNWGKGNLNGDPSSVKTNGTSHKRFGGLGVSGVSGVVKNNGAGHEAVFELSGDEILKEGGVPLSRALAITIPPFAVLDPGALQISHQAFLSGGVKVSFESQFAPGSALVPQEVTTLQIGLGTIGVVELDLDLVPLTVDRSTYELGGTLFVDFDDAVKDPDSYAGGYAELVFGYKAL